MDTELGPVTVDRVAAHDAALARGLGATSVGPIRGVGRADQRRRRRSAGWCWRWPGTTRCGVTVGSTANSSGWAHGRCVDRMGDPEVRWAGSGAAPVGTDMEAI